MSEKLSTFINNKNIKLTYKDYLLLPEDKRYEIIEGELYMVPSPEFLHQNASFNLSFVIGAYVKKYNLGKVLFAPMDVYLSDIDIVQPDILFISNERLRIIKPKYIKGAPDLVIEILSRRSTKKDLILKRDLYAKYGVKEYWIVDIYKKRIHVLELRENGFVEKGTYSEDEFVKSNILKKLRLKVSDIF